MAAKTERHPVLLVSSRSGDHASLRRIFGDSPWDLQAVFTGRDCLRLLRGNRRHISVVICEHTLPDGGWKPLIKQLDKLPGRPRLIVSSRLADERLWAEVLNVGAFDLLVAEPFEAEEVLRVTESAWRAGRGVRLRSRWRIGPAPSQGLVYGGARALAMGSHA